METSVLFLLSSSRLFHIAAEIVRHETHTANVFLLRLLKSEIGPFPKKKLRLVLVTENSFSLIDT